MTRLILASSSPRRADLLRATGIPFKVCSPRIQEYDGENSLRFSPRQIVIHNAMLKAEFVIGRFRHHWVLGADTVVVLGRQIFGKPHDTREAGNMLRTLCGRTHRVITGACLFRKGRKKRVFTVTTKVTFKHLSHAQIRRYLKLIHPLDKAGAYAAQEHADRIIQRVEGSFSNVIGLPMERLIKELKMCLKSRLWNPPSLPRRGWGRSGQKAGPL